MSTLENFNKMLSYLHRSGTWSYWWTVDTGGKKLTHWWPAGSPAAIPEGMNTYFGVHPANKKGTEYERSKVETVAAINCLFAEFDETKGSTIDAICHLPCMPSVLIRSGGGWHGYWLLRDPFVLATDADRKHAQELQAVWVKLMGGDQAAKDLARVLRVPGSYNHKYDPPRPVDFVWSDFNLLYDRSDLEELCKPQEQSKPTTRPQDRNNGHFPQENGAHWLKQAFLRATVGNRNETGLWLACQLRDNGLVQSAAEGVAREYAAGVPGEGYSEGEALASVEQAYTRPRRDPAHGNGRFIAYVKTDLSPTQPTPGGHKLDDIGNGERLTIRHGDKMRFVKEWGWVVWNGKYWEQDRGLIARWGKETARSIYAEVAACEDEAIAKDIAKHAKSSASKFRREAMIDAAASEPGIQASPDDFDHDPWLLNVQNGILDLRTGTLSPHSPEAMMTKIAGAAFDPEAGCGRWYNFLYRVFDADEDLISFVNKAVGYSLTGDTREQCLFFAHGRGANGKSTFTGLIQDLLGNYSMKTRAEILMINKQNTIPEEVAQIAGVRFMLAAELGEGERLNESLVKDLTGGDRLRARLLYRQSFEFIPIAKPWLYGNHTPVIRGTDIGIWRRVHKIPFSVVIPEDERDPELPTKLRSELPGILNWALDGCIAWQKEGLRPPAIVKRSTADYRTEQDVLGAFLEECCNLDSQVFVTAKALYSEYKTWATDGGLNPISAITFSRQMSERGFSTTKRESGTGRALYAGLGLKVKVL